MAKGCSGKIRHPDRVAAIIVMKRMKNKGLETYHCRFCKGWHVGTSNKDYMVQRRLDQLLGTRNIK